MDPAKQTAMLKEFDKMTKAERLIYIKMVEAEKKIDKTKLDQTPVKMEKAKKRAEAYTKEYKELNDEISKLKKERNK
jgi:hypothetical protein